MMLRGLAVILAFTLPAQAEDALLATLEVRSGTVAPAHAWSVSISMTTDGLVTVRRCSGYETDGPACMTVTSSAAPEKLKAISSAARISGLATRPAKPLDPPMVGGGSISGTVILDGKTIEMIAQPDPEDAERVNTLIDIVRGAIPRELDPMLGGD